MIFKLLLVSFDNLFIDFMVLAPGLTEWNLQSSNKPTHLWLIDFQQGSQDLTTNGAGPTGYPHRKE